MHNVPIQLTTKRRTLVSTNNVYSSNPLCQCANYAIVDYPHFLSQKEKVKSFFNGFIDQNSWRWSRSSGLVMGDDTEKKYRQFVQVDNIKSHFQYLTSSHAPMRIWLGLSELLHSIVCGFQYAHQVQSSYCPKTFTSAWLLRYEKSWAAPI